MRSQHDPRNAATPPDPDFESTDGGWDPYVTSLLMTDSQPRDVADEDEDDGAPVMSFSRGRVRER